MKVEAMPDAVRGLIDEVNTLRRPAPENRKATRKKIKSKLGEIAKARAELVELQAYRDDLAKELEDRTSEHQAEAKKLQTQLQSQSGAEKRVALRQQLGTINAAFQSQADAINAKLAAADEEGNDLRLLLYAEPLLTRSLLETGKPEALRELSVSRTTLSLAEQRSKTAAKSLKEYEAAIRYARETQARYIGENSWRPLHLNEREEKPLVKADDPIEGDEQYELLKLEATTAASIAAEAATEVSLIEKEISEE